MPRYIIALDTETKPEFTNYRNRKFRHRFRLGVTVSGQYRRGKVGSRTISTFSDREKFWDILRSLTHHRHTVWCVCTNALFDLVTIGMPDKVSIGEYTLDSPRGKRTKGSNCESVKQQSPLVCLESPPFILGLRCVATEGRVVFVDTLNWFKSSVEELGMSVGLDKLSIPDFSASDKIWSEYCQRDAEITFESFVSLIKWSKSNDLGVFRYTAASQSMGAFRHRHMPCEIHYHDNAAVKFLERESFIGGRIECFRIGAISEKVYQVDANSLYPSVMVHGLYPRRLNVFDLDTTPKPLPDIGGWQRCVAEVDIETDKPLYPLRQDDITLYPTGCFRTVLAGVELDNAIRAGHIKTVGRWSKYKLAPLFTSFVSELWEMRSRYKLDGNKAYENCCKSILNSLFGKFAQRPIKWVQCEDRSECLDWLQWCELDFVSRKPVMYRSIGGYVYKQNHETERPDTLVAISSFIAAAARVKMNQYREIAGIKNVYYQGVDGLLINQSGYDRLCAYGSVSDDELGKLRLQKVADILQIYNCADYQIGSDKVIAGRPGKIVTGLDGKEERRKFSSLQSLFCGPEQHYIYETAAEWTRRGEYRKGTIGNDGWITPHQLTV